MVKNPANSPQNKPCPILWDVLGMSGIANDVPDGTTVYFDRPDVKKALHVPPDVTWTQCKKTPVYLGGGGKGGDGQNGDLSVDPIQGALPRVIEATQRVLVANGDFDFVIMTNGTLLAIQNMTWGGSLGFQSQPSDPLYIPLRDIQHRDALASSGLGIEQFVMPQGMMGIQHFERGLMWNQVWGAGHMLPAFQPRVAFMQLLWMLGHIDSLGPLSANGTSPAGSAAPGGMSGGMSGGTGAPAGNGTSGGTGMTSGSDAMSGGTGAAASNATSGGSGSMAGGDSGAMGGSTSGGDTTGAGQVVPDGNKTSSGNGMSEGGGMAGGSDAADGDGAASSNGAAGGSSAAGSDDMSGSTGASDVASGAASMSTGGGSDSGSAAVGDGTGAQGNSSGADASTGGNAMGGSQAVAGGHADGKDASDGQHSGGEGASGGHITTSSEAWASGEITVGRGTD